MRNGRAEACGPAGTIDRLDRLPATARRLWRATSNSDCKRWRATVNDGGCIEFARSSSVALGGGAVFGGEAQRESTRGANGLRTVLAAVAAIGDSNSNLHDLVCIFEADDDGRK